MMADSLKPVRLSPRMQQISECIAQGMSNNEIAVDLGLTVNTVKQYIHLLRLKFPIHLNRRRLVSVAAQRQYEAAIVSRLRAWLKAWSGKIPSAAEAELNEMCIKQIWEIVSNGHE